MRIRYANASFLMFVIILGAILTYIGIQLNHKVSPVLRNLTVGFVLTILAMDLIPKITGQNNSENKLVSLLGLLIGTALVLIFSTALIGETQQGVLELIVVAFVFGIIFSLSTPANIILGLALGSIIIMNLDSIKSDLLGALVIVFVLTVTIIGYQIGSHYSETPFYYFSVAMSIAILIWILISRLLMTNQNINKTHVSDIALIVFLGFVVGWLIH